MRNNSNPYNQEALERLLNHPQELHQVSQEVCERTLVEAKSRLHPLLQQADLERLGQRPEFVQAFKTALEKHITQQILLRLSYVKAIYRFDNINGNNMAGWDNKIHLLVLVPELMPLIQNLGPKLDREIRQHLSSLNWSRFQSTRSIVEIQQVTPSEIKHGICYGAMFASFYAGPVQIWPSPQTTATCYTIKQMGSQTKSSHGGKVAPAGFK